MPNAIVLPKNKKALVRAIRNAADAAAKERNVHAARWYFTYLYLQGCRKFRNLDFDRGRVQAVWETNKGKLNFELAVINQAIDTEVSRFDSINLAPASRKLTESLDGLRKASMGQVVLDDIVSSKAIADTNEAVFRNMILYGMCGVVSDVQKLGDGKTTVYNSEVIPPWEIGSIPAEPASLDEVGAIIRDRQVPLEWLRGVARSQSSVDGDPVFSIPKDEAKLQSRPVRFGDTPSNAHSPTDGTGSSGIHANFDTADPSDTDDDDSTPFVRLIEVWERNRADDSLRRYTAVVGDVLLADNVFGDEAWHEANPDIPRPPPFPVWINQYSATGSGLYSRGFAEMAVALNTEMESMLQSVTKMVKEWDEMGVTYIPGNIGVSKRDFKISTKPKQVFYEVDPSSPQARPFQTRPVNAGTTPMSVLSLLLSLADRQAAQSPLLRGQAPGRVDSNSALSTLFQASNIPLSGPARSLASARRKVYRALLYEAKRRWSESDKLRLSTIDDSVAGLVVSAQDMSVKIDTNGLPWPHEVDIGVKSTEAEDKAQKQQLAMQLADSKKELWVYNYRDKLGLPDMKPRIRESVRKAMLNNVLIYGDGKTPGDSLLDEDGDDLEVLKMVLEDFMARVEFSLAEPDVKEAFKLYQNELKSRVGGGLPQQAPDIVQAAIQQQQLLAAQQQAGI